MRPSRSCNITANTTALSLIPFNGRILPLFPLLAHALRALPWWELPHRGNSQHKLLWKPSQTNPSSTVKHVASSSNRHKHRTSSLNQQLVFSFVSLMLFSHLRGSSCPQTHMKLLSFFRTSSQLLQIDVTVRTLVLERSPYYLLPERRQVRNTCRGGSNRLHLRPEHQIQDWFWTAQNTLDCAVNCLLIHGPRDLDNQRAFSGALACFLQVANLWFYTPRRCGSNLKPGANIKSTRTDAVLFSSQKPSGWHSQPSHLPPVMTKLAFTTQRTFPLFYSERKYWNNLQLLFPFAVFYSH